MKLRSDVEIHDREDSCTIVDGSTGLKLAVPRDIARFLNQLRSETFAPSVEAQEEGLVPFFRQLGFFGDMTPDEARKQQGRYILTDAEFAELPRIRETVQRAFQQTALHRAHLASALRGEWDLETLPILDKAHMRRHFPRGLTLDGLDLNGALRRGDLMLASTSGTTGERLQTYSDTRLPRLPHDFAALWGLGVLPSDRPLRTAVLTSPGCSGGVCTRRSASMQERTSFEHTLFLDTARDPFDLSARHVESIASELALFTPELWVVNPVYLTLLAEAARRHGITLPRPRAIVGTYQSLSAGRRAAFARAFDVPVVETYSATELGGSQVAIRCREGALHVRLDHVFLEIVRDGARVEPGQLGNPVVTTHHPSMPLVRYQLSDLARFALAPCSCEVGSAWPTLIVEGRERDAFLRERHVVTPAMIDAVLDAYPVLLYQLREVAPAQFRLEVVTEAFASLAKAELASALRGLLGATSLEVDEVARLPFEESGKFRFTFPYEGPGRARS